MDNNHNSNIINVTSFNQKGGITANQVNIGIKRDRHINEILKRELRSHLQEKDQIIEISAIINDPEAFQFADEIKIFLEQEDYRVKGVHSTMYARPPIGNIIEARNQGGIKIIIGVNTG